MAKNMARIKDGIVVNIEWRSNGEEETDVLKETNNLMVNIGDTYDGSFFYRDEKKLLTPLEEANAEIALLKEKNAMLMECLLEMSETVYA